MDTEEVNEVVVDRVWSEDVKTSLTHSELAPSPEKLGSYPVGPSASDNESVHHGTFWTLSSHLVVLRWRLWPAIVHFFSSRFADEKSEQHYAQVRLTSSKLPFIPLT
jgi:osomolarity two-component system sensor histidine kinase SLN1